MPGTAFGLANLRETLRSLIHRKAELLAGVVVMVFLTGCAAQLAYRDGKDLVAQGKIEQGLAKFQEALSHSPKDAEYRSAYLQTRERAVSTFAEQGDRLISSKDSEGARRAYQRALGIDPANVKALAGLAALDSDVKQTKLLKEAEAAFAKKDVETAKQKLSAVLTENPDNQTALALRHTIAEQNTSLPLEALLAKAYKKQITIEFKDVALKQIFEVISRTSGLNFLFDKEVKTDQKTSIYLKNSSIESAVHFVLLTNQLEEQILDGNTVLIYPNTAAKLKDYQEMMVRTFFLTNAEAKTVANTLKTIVKTHDIVVDEKLNMLILRDSPEAIRLAEKLVALQDVAEPEVMLEVEVLEVQRTRLQDLGIQWPASLSVSPLPLGTAISSSGTTTGSTTTTTTNPSSTLSLNDLLHQNRNSLGVTVGNATLNANVQDSDAKLLTNPRIRVRNHEKAKILIGERVPNITSTATSTGFVSESINYIDIGLTLNVEPTIYLDDDVGIKVSLEVSSIISNIKTSSGTSAYEIGTRTATTVLRLKNGETDVLAGLIDNQERTSGNKIPGIGELPVLGRLFGATTNDNQKTEIVLSITPHLIRNIQRPSASEASFLAGTETSLRSRPESSSGLPINTPQPASAVPAHANLITPTSPTALPAGASVSVLGDVSSGTSSTSGTVGSSSLNSGTGSPPISSGDVGIAGGAIAATGLAQLQWQGINKALVGSNVAVAVTLQSTQPITQVPITVGFDNTKLQVVGVSEGGFLKQSGMATSFTSRIDPSGQVIISDATAGTSGATNSAVFATITFRALAAANATNIQLLSATPQGIGGVTVTATPPAPFTLQIEQP